MLNVNGKPITLDDILEETSLYINSSLFPVPADPGTVPNIELIWLINTVTYGKQLYIKHRRLDGCHPNGSAHFTSKISYTSLVTYYQHCLRYGDCEENGEILTEILFHPFSLSSFYCLM